MVVQFLVSNLSKGTVVMGHLNLAATSFKSLKQRSFGTISVRINFMAICIMLPFRTCIYTL